MMNFEEVRNNGDLLFESIRGSHLFGLNTETSDIDTFGVFCGPEDWFLGNGKDKVDMIKSEKSDDYWDELGKYFFELGKSNPEALVSLFTPEKHILHFDPILQPLWDIREQLLTKECFKSFSGYAYSQIKKAKGLKKAINTDPEEVKERKKPLDFCQVAVGIGTHTLTKWLADHNLKQEYCGISRLPNTVECFSLFYDWGKARESGETVPNEFKDKLPIGYRGILSLDDPLTSQLRVSSIPKDETPLCWFQFNHNAYTSHCCDYKRYWDWVKNRNEARFKLNTGHNYDCYSAPLTKFLTTNGWRWYNEIKDDDLIGCFDLDGCLKFSKIKSRSEHEINDPILSYEDVKNHIVFNVTLNHRLYLRREDWEDFRLITAEDWLREKDSYKFYQLKYLNNKNADNKKYSREILELFGEFLGYYGHIETPVMSKTPIINFRGSLKNQDKYRKTISTVLGINEENIETAEYDLKVRSDINGKTKLFTELMSAENRITLSSNQLLYIFNGFSRCFELSSYQKKSFCKFKDKVINNFEYDILSNAILGNILFDVKLVRVYNSFTSVFLCSIPKDNDREVLLDPKLIKIRKFDSTDPRSKVVCFETETGTLITWGYSEVGGFGKAFHGNSKNMSHCVRIFTMATEIADGKGMILDRSGIDREFLLSIKNHEISYDDMMKYVEEKREIMEESFIKSNLPESPDLDLLNKIMIGIRKSHYGKH